MKATLTKSIAVILTLAIFCYPTPKTINAQETPNVNTVEITIPDGTELIAVLEDEISSASATEGDPINFKLKDDLKINGKVVIARDTLIKGTIANAQKAGRMGKGGKLGIRVESTTAIDGQKIRLRASKGGEGGDKVGTVIALTVFFGFFGLLKKGKNAKIKKGTEIKTYTDESKVVKVQAA
jgi:hypothetical protein